MRVAPATVAAISIIESGSPAERLRPLTDIYRTAHLTPLGMSTAIIGIAASGKTTIFNALTRGATGKGQFGAVKSANIGVGAKPDARLDFLDAAFAARRKVRAEMTFWDLPVDYASGDVLTGETITSLQRAKALLVVVRNFDDPAVPHPDGGVDWLRDLEKMLFDIVFADIALLDRRVERISDSMKALKSSERGRAVADIAALQSLQSRLEDGAPIRAIDLDEDQSRAVSNVFAISALPVVVGVNVGEDEIGIDAGELREQAVAALGDAVVDDATAVIPICGRLEEELRGMEEAEAAEFRAELGVERDDSETLMDACLQSLDTQTFYTASDREVRAWHFHAGAHAPEAAGVVHSDMERGFIRAEIVAYDDFVRCGSMPEARKQGKLRQEGRAYVVRDGDMANFLFSV